MKNITIVGGGPAALMLANHLDTTRYNVTIYDQKKSVGRKFLVAGEGGLNLTYSSPISELTNQYVPQNFMATALTQFTNEDLITWLETIGIPTFIGSSNRVFPSEELKPIEVLNKIVENLKTKGINFQLNKQWNGWTTAGDLHFEGQEDIVSDIVVFALGGASWKVTGSDGEWINAFEQLNIKTIAFRSANCAFGVNWKKTFIATYAGKPLKNIAVRFANQTTKGELVLSKFGLEGNAIYALSRNIQQALESEEHVDIEIDLKPMLTTTELMVKYQNSTLSKVTGILKEDLNLDRTAIGLLKQFTDKEAFTNPDLLIATIKAVPITLSAVEDIDRAISTLGGIDLDEVDEHFQLKKIPNTYAIGEMLDWYAPTGGYLLQGCFSMGFSLAQHLNESITDNENE
ncbi:TIGR03862 family flavoprotein [Bacteroidia bacterium]|nr:TIGR03862 family flavoprotein [Bacteroidia bacterium]